MKGTAKGIPRGMKNLAKAIDESANIVEIWHKKSQTKT
jgi:hypothetical protein